MATDIKTMQLYPRPERIYADLAARGFDRDAALPVELVSALDQLHYHGTAALDAAIAACHIKAADQVLEVGSGWGGCARHLAHATGARVTAVELQADYDHVARDLTDRTGLADRVRHVNADFLTFESEKGSFSCVVSWLALFHIPRRPDYLARISAALAPGGRFFAGDLYLIQAPDAEETADFQRHLFPNSLVPRDTYLQDLEQAGFEGIVVDDMTRDWADFTADRLEAFHGARAQYVSVHGEAAYHALEVFYAKMAGYFARGLVGGLRFCATRRADG